MNLARPRIKSVIIALIPIALMVALATGVWRVRTDSKEAICHGNMAGMAVHLFDYRDLYGHFPPAVFTGAGTKPLHSWRVSLHSYVERTTQNPEFDRAYHFDQRWDSPANLANSKEVPPMFVCPNNQGEPRRYTNYVALIDRGVSSLEWADAIPRNSPEAALRVLLIEHPNSDILWTEPRDLHSKELPSLRVGSDPRGLGVIFADGHFRRLSVNEIGKIFSR